MENNTDTDNRIDQFKSDVTEMKLKTGSATRDAVFQTIGLVLMLVGVAGAFIIYVSSKNLNDVRDVTSQVVFAVAFLTLSVFGAAIFLRFALANFLRMWLLRQLYEGSTNTDRIVEAVKGR
jgi:hypothetical protein